MSVPRGTPAYWNLLAERAQNRHYVYRLFDTSGRLIYIGCSYDPETRINSHRRGIWWGYQIERIKLTVHPTKAAAHAVERLAIQKERPRWNVGSNWASRHGWSASDFADYILAYQMHPDEPAVRNPERIAEAKRLMALAA